MMRWYCKLCNETIKLSNTEVMQLAYHLTDKHHKNLLMPSKAIQYFTREEHETL